MERVRSLTRRVGPLVPAVLLAAGCVAPEQIPQKMTETVNKVIPLDPAPAPATQVLCFWQRRLAPLPDPTRDGAQTLGLPGQMFLIAPDNRPAEVTGDLAVVVYDETPRPPGVPAMRPEVWHYTKDVLQRLVTNDERFGRSYALFLPWPAHWRDVTTVKITARYQSPGSPDLFASEVKFHLDTSTGPVWQEVAPGSSPARPSAGSMLTSQTVIPDPSRLLRDARAGNQPAQVYATPPSQPTGVYTMPAQAYATPPAPPTGGNPPYGNYAPPARGAVPPAVPGTVGFQPPNWPPAPSIPQVPPPQYQSAPPTVQPPAMLPQYQPAPPADGPLQPIVIPRPAGG